MKRFKLLTIALLSLCLLSSCQLQESYSGKLILSGDHTLSADERIAGELLITGGEAHLQAGSQVQGSVHILGGTVQLDGQVEGDVMLLAGRLALGPEAVIGGDLNAAGGELTGSETARILGQVHQPSAPAQAEAAPGGQAGQWVSFLLELPILTILAALSARFLPGHLSNIGHAATRYWVPSMALGLLGWVVGLSLLLLMAYTILLIPLTILGFFAMLAATSIGAVPYALLVGRWLSRRLHWNPSAPLSAGLGMITLVLLVGGVRLIPVLDTILPVLLFTASFGAVLLTRFGLRRFVPPQLEGSLESMV